MSTVDTQSLIRDSKVAGRVAYCDLDILSVNLKWQP